jgi:hypothetical protein
LAAIHRKETPKFAWGDIPLDTPCGAIYILLYRRRAMGKKVITIEGKYYIVDDETGDVKRVIIQDDPNLSLEEMKKILKLFAMQLKD